MGEEYCKTINLSNEVKKDLALKIQEIEGYEGKRIEVLGMIAANTISFPHAPGLHMVWDEMEKLQKQVFGENEDIENIGAIQSWKEFPETVTDERLVYSRMYPGLPWRFDTIVFRVVQ